MGQIHLNSRDPEAQRKFWNMLGAKPAAKVLANNDAYKVQGALIFVRRQNPTGGSEDSVVSHIGFRVVNLDNALDKCRMAGFGVITPAEVAARTHKAHVMAPDNINVELVADTALGVPIASHHIHFYDPHIQDMRAWYVTTFGAVPGKRDAFEAADLPGINLSYSPGNSKKAPTNGRAVDHIGFEVRNLEAFCKKLESAGVKFDRPFKTLPDLRLSNARFTDPWGTSIELTEGLREW